MKKHDAFNLKVIAILAMLINHIGHTFEAIWNPPVWTFFYLSVGLLTFPIMAYLMVDGFYYTRNRWKYAGRLGFFSLLSFIPFHYTFSSPLPMWVGNNIMFTLMMGVLMMMVLEKCRSFWWEIPVVLAFITLTLWSDWQLFGILIIYVFYRFRQSNHKFWVIPFVSLIMVLLSWNTYESYLQDLWLGSLVKAIIVANLGILLVIPILLSYNGQRGYSPIWVKWGFYAFYPGHLLVLWGIRFMIFGY
ncbi:MULTISPECIES: TraX family protein [Streptococcus]|uniref:TraX family protein n=1 Tax=Streptococcus caledonicus TaxID=2614158 RepID=A0ABW0UFT4_9STRE|nr:TraX family protein [Streptococcus sp. S784/96/1]